MQRAQVVAVVRGLDRHGQDGAGDVHEMQGGLVTFQRGDIVRLRADEEEAATLHSIEFRDEVLSRKYVVLDADDPGFRFRTAPDQEIWKPATWLVWRIGWSYRSTPMVVSYVDMIATGERAEEVK